MKQMSNISSNQLPCSSNKNGNDDPGFREEGFGEDKEQINANLREKCDVLDGDVKELHVLEEDRRRMKREIDENDEKLKGLIEKIRVLKEKEEMGIERIHGLCEEIKELEKEKEGFKGMVEGLMRDVREKEGVIVEYEKKEAWFEVVLEDQRRTIARFEEQKLKREALWDEIKRGKDDKIMELSERSKVEKMKIEDLRDELEGLREIIVKCDERINGVFEENEDVKKQFECLKQELEECRRKNESLEKEKLMCDERIKEAFERNVIEKREFEVKMEELEDVRRKIALLKERNAKFKAIVEKLKRNVEEKDERIKELLEKIEVEKRGFEFEAKARCEELEDIKRQNLFLVEEKAKIDSIVEKLKRDVEDKNEGIKELSEKIEVAKRGFESEAKALCEELEDIRKQNMFLAEQRANSDAIVEKIKRDVEDKDERIKKLLEGFELFLCDEDDVIEETDDEMQGMTRENRAIMTKLEELEKLMKVEANMISCIGFMDLDSGKERRFADTHVEKILSGIAKVIDSDEFSFIGNAGVEKDELIPEEDFAKTSKAINLKRSIVTDPIIIDSDDDNENPLHVNGVHNKRQCSNLVTGIASEGTATPELGEALLTS